MGRKIKLVLATCLATVLIGAWLHVAGMGYDGTTYEPVSEPVHDGSQPDDLPDVTWSTVETDGAVVFSMDGTEAVNGDNLYAEYGNERVRIGGTHTPGSQERVHERDFGTPYQNGESVELIYADGGGEAVVATHTLSRQ